jgi:hypothetical protein
MTQVETAQIAPLDAFELLPDALVRIELRSIRRQTLQVDPWRRTVGEEVSDDLTAMDRRAIPNDHQAARHLTPQVRQKGHHIRRIQGVVLAVEIQLALRG